MNSKKTNGLLLIAIISLSIFGGLFSINGCKSKSSVATRPPLDSNIINVTEIRVVYDTLRIRDTIYLRDTVYLETESTENLKNIIIQQNRIIKNLKTKK